jgi:hypothetical protein
MTLAQAALLAAIGEALLALYYTITLIPSIRSDVTISSLMPLVLGAIVPSLIWAGFFIVLFRERTGLVSPISFRTVTWITLILGIGLEVVFVAIPFEMATISITPLGIIRRIVGWLLRLGWAAFLISFALSPDPAPDKRTRRIALVLAIISAPSVLSTAYAVFNNSIAFLFDDIPRQAFWRALITPVIRTIYWLSQILFLWRAWGNPQRAPSR